MYSPVITGIPAIVVYPITSGMPSAASVTPAITSVDTRDRSIGRTPSNTGSRRRVCVALIAPPIWLSSVRHFEI